MVLNFRIPSLYRPLVWKILLGKRKMFSFVLAPRVIREVSAVLMDNQRIFCKSSGYFEKELRRGSKLCDTLILNFHDWESQA